MATDLLEKLNKFIELEKATGPGKHEHDGWAEHPVAVKDHQKFFAGTPSLSVSHWPINTVITDIDGIVYQKVGDNEWRSPDDNYYDDEEIKDSLEAAPSKAFFDIKFPSEESKKENLTDEQIESALNDPSKLEDILLYVPTGTLFYDDKGMAWKKEDGGWKRGADGFTTTSSAIANGYSYNFKNALLASLQLGKKTEPKKEQFGDIINKKEISLEGGKQKTISEITDYLDNMPIGSAFISAHIAKHKYVKKPLGTWKELGTGQSFGNQHIAYDIQNFGENNKLFLPEKDDFGSVPTTQQLTQQEIKQKLDDFAYGIIPYATGSGILFDYTQGEISEDDIHNKLENIYGYSSNEINNFVAQINAYKKDLEQQFTGTGPSFSLPQKHLFIDKLDNAPIGTTFKQGGGAIIYKKEQNGEWGLYDLNNKSYNSTTIPSILYNHIEDSSEDVKESSFNELAQTFSPPKDSWDDKLEELRGQLGSRPGGLYQDKTTGQKYYVKHPGSTQATYEHIANQLYKLAGVAVADTELIDLKGLSSIKSSWLEDAEPMTADVMRNSSQIRENFAIDAWLGNWDVVGLDADNIVNVGGKHYRIDPGGALIFRAQGHTKDPDDFGDEVKELKTMLDPNINPQTSNVFRDISKETMQKGAIKLAHITDEQIDNVVKAGKNFQGGWGSEKLAETLKKRRDYILDKLDINKKTGRTRKECPPGFHRHDKFQQCHPETQKHRGEKGAFGKGLDVPNFLRKHKNQKVKELFQSSQELEEEGYNNSLYDFAEKHGIYNEISETNSFLVSWQSGGKNNPVRLRAAIAELKGEADNIYSTESAYFLYQQDVAPDVFDKDFKSGREASVGLIPVVSKTQKYLREIFPSGKMTIYRGLSGFIAEKLRQIKDRATDESVIPIANDGISGFSLDRDRARTFAGTGGVILKKEVPIEAAWVYFNALENMAYQEEKEILVDSTFVSTFKKDEIEETTLF